MFVLLMLSLPAFSAAGVSRSSTITLAYMMTTLNITYDQAITILRAFRPIASPNHGFVQQLEEFYKNDMPAMQSLLLSKYPQSDELERQDRTYLAQSGILSDNLETNSGKTTDSSRIELVEVDETEESHQKEQVELQEEEQTDEEEGEQLDITSEIKE
eukprot:TRINITY_DN3103_c0_g1_i3.p1 TRINITY_DN3103_c0_g1~~TRINITY_DN3103_c0_g1_i3.p1  ORF type:complete len:158 (-),score=35.95 TRINITY_DN3103_c0_g1_i3:126-599(-)